ncbi:hypothetical protein IWW50_003168 [Coemansia erecta]|nr:hypothetical protein GGF43_002559 [Coemansia sp. RSA 2618]KAJ2824780.1 hypothetical protein IWW50_003168 [Coemansia erecta]
MPEIQPDHFARQFPNRHNPPEFALAPAPSTFFAVLGGTFAALSSVSAKLTVSQPPPYLAALLAELLPAHAPALITRAAMVAATLACNFFMWLFFTKALRYGESTPRVMMLQTATNFAVTAVCGVYLFGDALSVQWWAGASLIAAGLVALNSEKAEFVCEGPDGAMGLESDGEARDPAESKKSR